MMVYSFLLALGAVVIFAQSEEEPVAQIFRANRRFGNDLYRVLSKNEKSNLGFSPISLHAALSMAYQGAQGTTAEAFSHSLMVDTPQTTALGYHEIIPELNKIQGITLAMADKVFVMEGAVVLRDFQRAITRDFYSAVQRLNFAQNIEAAEAINSWVEQETDGRITDLVKSDDLDEDTRLVLVNALYFKAQWAYIFNSTRSEKFYLNEKESVDVDMMRLGLDLDVVPRLLGTKFIPEIGARVLEIPYANKDFSMVILLPDDFYGLKDMETKLVNFDLATVTNDLIYETEVVYLPKFTVEQSIDLEDTLTELGLGEIFDENKANFRGMIELAEDQPLWVEKVVQKVFIEVNEEGSEAAAATEVIIVTKSTTAEFRANHPFVFLIMDDSTKDVIFYGRITKPQSSK